MTTVSSEIKCSVCGIDLTNLDNEKVNKLYVDLLDAQISAWEEYRDQKFIEYGFDLEEIKSKKLFEHLPFDILMGIFFSDALRGTKTNYLRCCHLDLDWEAEPACRVNML